MRSASTTRTTRDSFEEVSGVSEDQNTSESLLGSNLAANMPPEDVDDRQYWIWDLDELEDEPCP